MKDESSKMNDVQKSINCEEIPLTDELVVSYLQDNPEFFNRNNSLMTSLRLNDEQRGTVSLVERQQQLLRQKVHGLEDEITQLMSVANHNEQLFVLYSDLYLRLLDCQSAEELLDCLHQATTELLSLSAFKLWLVPTDNSSISHHSLSTNDCAGVMQNRLTNEEYYFGRLQESEQILIFSQPCSGSVVLIKLIHDEQSVGFLAIGSEDAHHFDPRMDTLLLNQFKRLVAKLLHQQLKL
ncbi:DUF484 family protein [Colwellia psychrerythraea]|uniref:DUF484 domain-containing protein n=1 Tax=Colwellia psychrerythraea TaxID=28229 RepID=A0A099L3Z7_COLPS|nr:DUF484 family protein [Colwellia psychrerythraea]KGJ97669.1 protein of unknown function DUF484 [Colwellia psychrerythraea]